jgi:hypothetical protein
MDREELNEIVLAEAPFMIRMNDGRAYEVKSKEFITISDIAASVLYRHEDGKLRHVYLPLVTMSAIGPIPNGA